MEERVVAQLKATAHLQPADLADSRHSPCLEAICREALRLLPPVPIIERLVTEETDLSAPSWRCSK
jgi:cytochrome P450